MEYSIDDILAAKETVKNAGYGVSLPNNKLDIAKNIAKANGYTVRKANTDNRNDINTALRVATDAGYTVRKAPAEPVSRPAPKSAPAPAPAKPAPAPATPAPATPAPAPAPTPAPAKPAEPSWVEKIASRYV
jgi:hypothetical protein